MPVSARKPSRFLAVSLPRMYMQCDGARTAMHTGSFHRSKTRPGTFRAPAPEAVHLPGTSRRPDGEEVAAAPDAAPRPAWPPASGSSCPATSAPMRYQKRCSTRRAVGLHSSAVAGTKRCCAGRTRNPSAAGRRVQETAGGAAAVRMAREGRSGRRMSAARGSRGRDAGRRWVGGPDKKRRWVRRSRSRTCAVTAMVARASERGELAVPTAERLPVRARDECRRPAPRMRGQRPTAMACEVFPGRRSGDVGVGLPGQQERCR